MAEELQGLLERLHNETVKKADEESQKIISSAKAEAEKIIANAKAEAELQKKKAEEDSLSSEARAKAAIQQAARDIILSLKSSLNQRLVNLVKSSVSQAMTPDFMGKIILEMSKSYAKSQDQSEPTIDLLLSQKDLEEMGKLINGALINSFKSKPEVSLGHDFAAGLKIGFKGSDVFFDFTDEAISEIICQYIGPKLAELLNDKK